MNVVKAGELKSGTLLFLHSGQSLQLVGKSAFEKNCTITLDIRSYYYYTTFH